MIRDDNARKEIDEIIVEVFGENNMGYQSEEEGGDPFESGSSSEEEEDPEEREETIIPSISAYMDCDSA